MNPEFQRNLWLEASPRRITWAVVTLVLIYGAVALISGDSSHRDTILATSGAVVFVACAVFWAGRIAGMSVLTEVAERTWDFQRLSALSAWDMTWGKLFGATLLASGSGATGAILFLAFAHDPQAGWHLLMMLAAALLLQAASFMAALAGVRKARAEGRLARTGGVMGGMVIGYFVLSGVATRAFNSGHSANPLGWIQARNGLVGWWNTTWTDGPFWAVTILVFGAFALAGAWRLMRLELQMRGEPLVWPIFLVVAALWVAGFSVGQHSHWAGLTAASMAMSLAAYAAAFVEPADRVALRRFGRLAAQGEVAEATRIAPAAAFPLVLAALLTLAAFGLQSGPYGSGDGGRGGALLAFLVRDLGVIALFRFGPRPQRGDIGAVIALALLYGVGGIFGTTLGGKGGAALFLPVGGDAALVSVLSALAQAGFAWVIAVGRIRAPEISVSAPPSGPASAPAS